MFGLIMVAGASLSACSKQAGGDAVGNDPFAASGRVEDKFGKGFGKAFRADPNSEPAKVADGDMVPVSLTAEPVEID